MKKIGLEFLLFAVRLGIFLKRILVFSGKLSGRMIGWVLVRTGRRPLVGAYKLYLKLQSRLEHFGDEIKNPLLYLLSSKTLVNILLVGMGFSVALVNMSQRETAPDVENPHNVLSRVIAKSDEAGGGQIEEETALPIVEQSYASLSAVQPSLVGEDDSAVAAMPSGQIALNPGALIKPILPTVENRVAEPNANRTYVVQEGDTIGGIAHRFGLKLTTILWANNLSATSPLRIGQRLTILPRDGVLYRVRSGDTLAAIAHQFQTTVDKIMATNSLASDRLAIGTSLMIPDGVLSAPSSRALAQKPTLLGRIKNILTPRANIPTSISGALSMLWPTTARRITQYFSWRHSGVDIAGPPTNSIISAAAGTVELAGWQRGYGNTIVLNHGNGKKTRYAHASRLFVRSGQRVQKGDVIARVGSTGRSTGPHLHFEVLIGGRRVNPLAFIR